MAGSLETLSHFAKQTCSAPKRTASIFHTLLLEFFTFSHRGHGKGERRCSVMMRRWALCGRLWCRNGLARTGDRGSSVGCKGWYWWWERRDFETIGRRRCWENLVWKWYTMRWVGSMLECCWWRRAGSIRHWGCSRPWRLQRRRVSKKMVGRFWCQRRTGGWSRLVVWLVVLVAWIMVYLRWNGSRWRSWPSKG